MKTITLETAEWLAGRVNALEQDAASLRAAIRSAMLVKASGGWVTDSVYTGATQRELDALEKKMVNGNQLLEELLKRVSP